MMQCNYVNIERIDMYEFYGKKIEFYVDDNAWNNNISGNNCYTNVIYELKCGALLWVSTLE